MHDSRNTDLSSNAAWHESRLLESGLFLMMILIEVLIFIFLIQGRYIIGGHDGFQYFTSQYCNLNNVVTAGEIPQWSPFMTHGTVAFMGYIAASGIFQDILFLSGSLFQNINFLPLFYLGIFLDELLLLTGVWLLGKRFFASPLTVFFVSLSILGSCIWVLQPWWNFHLYYAIPLILYFIHTFLDTGKWRYYFLAGNLLFIQCLGNLPYFLPVTSLVIFLYFLFYFLLNVEDTRQKIKDLRFGWAFIISTTLIIILFLALQAVMTIGLDQVVNYNALRNTDGTTTLDGFLNYGRIFTWKVWLEMILGISPFLDYTLYMGILCVPFVLLGFICVNRKNLHFLLTMIVLLLFAMGTFVSVVFYYVWPMMKYFRHLALVSPIIKVLLCFLAGFGFDAVFFNKSRWQNPLMVKTLLISSSVFMLGISLFLWRLSHNYAFGIHLLKNMAPAGRETLPFFTIIFNEEIFNALLGHTTFFALTAFILLAVVSLVRQKKYFILTAALLSLLHCADIYGFKISEIKLKTTPLRDELSQIIDFQPIPFAARRDMSFWNNNPRAELLNILPVREPGVLYSTTNALVFKDELGNQFRNDFWLRPFDNYMRAYWGDPINNVSEKPHALLFGFRLEFPQGHPAALKISGATEDKIQFFSGADILSSDEIIASLIASRAYKGDIIFLSRPDQEQGTDSVHPEDLSETYLASSKRLHLPYQVERFDHNHIEILTDNENRESSWLLYSDVWHPLWRATVNGKAIPVYRANLAYKAVKLEKGVNKIHFFFKSRFISTAYLIFNLNALCWLIIILYMAGKMVLNPGKHEWMRT